MKDKKDKGDLTPGHEQELFSNLEFSYSRSKDDVWNSLESLLDEEPGEKAKVEMKPEITSKADGTEMMESGTTEPEKEVKIFSINRTFMAIAASLALLLCAGLIARYYTTTVYVSPGEFNSHTLPDGSEVHLNAATTLSYHPYWWKVNRAVVLEGEAYFVVAKGEKFTVETALGNTQVLGTEFNVYARGDEFRVFCEEGRVKVGNDVTSNGARKEVILTAGELAVLELNPQEREESDLIKLSGEGKVARTEILSWRTGQFIYNTTPLSKVFQDLERQYGMTIGLSSVQIGEELYTGGFSRNMEFEQVLTVICGTSNLIYEKTGERTYLIKNQ